MQVKLYTAEGGFVHETRIPPFNEHPKILFWGIRVFALHAIEKRPDGAAEYREVFAYALVS